MAGYLGIDVGTSSVKVGLLADNGDWITRTAEVVGATKGLLDGEMDAEIWWMATRTALQELREAAAFSTITAIAAIGNTPTLVLVDQHGRPTYPALLWSDTRASREAMELLEERTQAQWDVLYGGHIPVSAAYPSAKLRWLQRHEPSVLAQTAKILQPKDFINYCLTHVMAGDHWTSKGLVNLASQSDYCPLSALDLDPALAPTCHRPIDIIGHVVPDAGQLTGIPAGVPVMAGWSDTLGAVLSLGLDEDDGFILSGTSDSIGVMTRKTPIPTESVLCAPVWDSGYHIVYGPTSSGLSTVSWANKVLDLDLFHDNFEDTVVDAEDRPLFVPFILGQRSPIWNDHVRGAWLNLEIHATRHQLGDAVLEGVVAAERDVFEAVEVATGIDCSRILVTGGGAKVGRMNGWRATIFGRRVFEASSDPVLGAALLAYWGMHATHDPITRPQMRRAVVHPMAPGAFTQNRYAQYCVARRIVMAYGVQQKEGEHHE